MRQYRIRVLTLAFKIEVQLCTLRSDIDPNFPKVIFFCGLTKSGHKFLNIHNDLARKLFSKIYLQFTKSNNFAIFTGLFNHVFYLDQERVTLLNSLDFKH